MCEHDMPCQCLECGGWTDLNEMHDTTGKLCFHSLVCKECFDNLESDTDD